VSEDFENTMNNLLDKARDEEMAGHFLAAESLMLTAWRSIPPDYDDNYWPQSLSKTFIEFYRDNGKFEEALKWVEETRRQYDADNSIDSSDYIDFVKATVLFESGDKDGAFDIFSYLYGKSKKRPFEGEDPKYLEFYRSRS
jgi:tetratricopeptide (TPR) repeat protein